MKIVKLAGTILERHENENARALAALNAANIDYLAMMSDIEIPTEEENTNESEV